MKFISFIETFAVAFCGGFLFQMINIPLPWVLGSLTFVTLWQGFIKRKIVLPSLFKEGGFVILGINFGLYFTIQTLQSVSQYLLPYIIITILLIIICIFIGWLVSKWTKIDKITAVFSSIPGGLTEMTLASESLKGNPGLVAIFQTIRLTAVLFTVPALITFIFSNSNDSVLVMEHTANDSNGNFLWYLLPIIIAIAIRNTIPAGLIIGALLITAVLNIFQVPLPAIPELIINGAQLMVGASIGKNVLINDIKKAGKYGLLFFVLAIIIIGIAFCLGWTMALITDLSLATALLSIAPGGLFEMVLTAYSVGGDPAIVSALQLTRILMIVIFVPSIVKWLFIQKKTNT